MRKLTGSTALQTASRYDEQATSPLFRLPLELREEIWAYTLAFPDDGKTVHFHIYAEVFDSCTYQAQMPASLVRRRAARHTALLRTCHAVHDETVQLLYDDRHFELVLFSGLPRPNKIATTRDKHEGSRDLRERNCLGMINDCAQLRRLRHATIIVQPGRFPKTTTYARRVTALLEALEFGQRMKSLDIRLNFAYGTGVTRPTQTIIKAFQPLALHKGHARRELTLSSGLPHARYTNAMRSCLAELQAALTIEGDPMSFFDSDHDESECFGRGTFGGDPAHPTSHYDTMSKGDKALAWALFVGLFPIIWPWVLVVDGRRFIVKGHGWRFWTALN
ncbi:hypothetical protein LTR85_004398 [Meristemomyces frigidus]|nr:hypothetical protein LTR85_004398 [Meristemomyces frigidus]